MGTNPYETPRAELLAETPLEGFGEALRGYSATKGIIRGLAVLAVLCGLGAGFMALAFSTTAGAYARGFGGLFVPLAIAYVTHGVLHWRLASRIDDARRKPEFASVIALLVGLRHSWLASLMLYLVSFGTSALSGAGVFTAMSSLVFADAVAAGAKSEAQRLFNVLRLVIAASIAFTVLVVFEQGMHGAERAVGAVVALVPFGGAYTWLLWRQAAPLQAFIAKPSPETLLPLARAHKLLWMVLAVGTVFVAAICAFAIVIVFAWSPEPDLQ